MAIEIITRFETLNSSNATSHTVSFSGRGVSVGDLLVVIAGFDDSGNANDPSSGWRRFILRDYGSGTIDGQFGVYMRIAASTTDSLVISGMDGEIATVAWVIRDHAITDINGTDIQMTDSSGTSTSSITPALSRDYVALWGGTAAAAVPSEPSGTGWGNFRSSTSGTSSGSAYIAGKDRVYAGPTPGTISIGSATGAAWTTLIAIPGAPTNQQFPADATTVVTSGVTASVTKATPAAVVVSAQSAVTADVTKRSAVLASAEVTSTVSAGVTKRSSLSATVSAVSVISPTATKRSTAAVVTPVVSTIAATTVGRYTIAAAVSALSTVSANAVNVKQVSATLPIVSTVQVQERLRAVVEATLSVASEVIANPTRRLTITTWQEIEKNHYRMPRPAIYDSAYFEPWPGTSNTVSVGIEDVPWSVSGKSFFQQYNTVSTQSGEIGFRPRKSDGTFVEVGERWTFAWTVRRNTQGTYDAPIIRNHLGAVWSYVARSPGFTAEADTPYRVYVTFELVSGTVASNDRVMMNPGGRTPGFRHWIADIDMYPGDYDPTREFFSGETLPPNDVTRFRWEGTPDSSASVMEERVVRTPVVSAVNPTLYKSYAAAVTVPVVSSVSAAPSMLNAPVSATVVVGSAVTATASAVFRTMLGGEVDQFEAGVFSTRFPNTNGGSYGRNLATDPDAISGSQVFTATGEGLNWNLRRQSEIVPLGTRVSAWIRARGSDVGPYIGGVTLARAANPLAVFAAVIDSRNGSGSTAGFQVRENMQPALATGAPPSETILPDTWYRIELWIEGSQVKGNLYNRAGSLIAQASRTPTSNPIEAEGHHPGIVGFKIEASPGTTYSYEDYLVAPPGASPVVAVSNVVAAVGVASPASVTIPVSSAVTATVTRRTRPTVTVAAATAVLPAAVVNPRARVTAVSTVNVSNPNARMGVAATVTSTSSVDPILGLVGLRATVTAVSSVTATVTRRRRANTTVPVISVVSANPTRRGVVSSVTAVSSTIQASLTSLRQVAASTPILSTISADIRLRRAVSTTVSVLSVVEPDVTRRQPIASVTPVASTVEPDVTATRVVSATTPVVSEVISPEVFTAYLADVLVPVVSAVYVALKPRRKYPDHLTLSPDAPRLTLVGSARRLTLDGEAPRLTLRGSA